MGRPSVAALCCHSVSSSWHEDIRHTGNRAVLSKWAFVEPRCGLSRQKALRKSHQKHPSLFAPCPEELPLDAITLADLCKSVHGYIRSGRIGRIVWNPRWEVWESVSFIEWCYFTQGGSHRVTCEEPRPLLLEPKIRRPSYHLDESARVTAGKN